jgi:hypothetical protein
MNAEIIERLEQSFEQVDKMEEFFGGSDKFSLVQMLAGAIGIVEAKAGSRWTDPDNVKVRGEIAQAICDVLAKKMPGVHSVHIATLGEDGRHIGGGSIAYASDEIAKGGLQEILLHAYSSQSTNSQRGGSKIVNQLEGAEAAAVERIAETITPLIDRAAKARLEPYFAFQTRLQKILDFFNEVHGRPPDTVKELLGWIGVKGWGIPGIWEDDLRPEEK